MQNLNYETLLKLFMQNLNYETLSNLFNQTKKMNKTNKTVIKIHKKKSLDYLLAGKTANHVNFMLSMPISCSCYV